MSFFIVSGYISYGVGSAQIVFKYAVICKRVVKLIILICILYYLEHFCILGSPSDRVGPALEKATITPYFIKMGEDRFSCDFDLIPMVDRAIKYDTLWKFNDFYIHEDPVSDNITSQLLPVDFVASITAGTKVDSLFTNMCIDLIFAIRYP